MSSTKHAVAMYWSPEDNVFVAMAPELPGCMAHGDTREEALEMIQQAMDAWMDNAKEFRDEVPEPTGAEVFEVLRR